MLNSNYAGAVRHCVVIYPFRGIEINSPAHTLFTKLIEQCRQSSDSVNPIVVLNQRSNMKEAAGDILHELGVEVLNYWGADTCDNWLAGWGYILDELGAHRSTFEKPEENHRIVLIPGDLQQVENDDDFFENLGQFIGYEGKPLLIGDFGSVNPFSVKELIDFYGIYLLVANWFPDAWQAIRSLKLRKPRSEFLNIRVPELRQLLQHRVFAYEQTLNMLILLWDSCLVKAHEDKDLAVQLWKKSVDVLELGNMADDSSDRNFRGAIDQIERTERMLRLVWRELKGWNVGDRFRKLAETYERLDERSTRIRDASRIAIWAQINS